MKARLELWYAQYYRWGMALVLGLLAASGSLIFLRSQPHADALGTWLLTVAVFLVALATWLTTAPRPADLWIDPMTREGEAALIFYLVDHPKQGRLPRDVMLHYELALANIGGRKTVLSEVALRSFVDPNGHPLIPASMPLPVHGFVVRQTFIWRDHREPTSGAFYLESFGQREQQSLPVVLEPDDAIVIRFRRRFGIDWSQRWIGSGQLEPVRELAESLSRDLAKAQVTAIFRRGRTLVTKSFTTAIRVEQQQEYASRLEAVTQGFTNFPTVEEQPFEPE